MDRSSIFFLQAILLAATLSGSSALRCYVCSSEQEVRCSDPIDKTLLPVDCNLESAKRSARSLANLLGTAQSLGVDAFGERHVQYGGGQPVNACQKLDVLVKGQNYTVRGCAILPTDDTEEHCRRISTQMQSESVQNTFCGSCKAEGCNGATGLSVSSTLALLLPASLAFLLASRA